MHVTGKIGKLRHGATDMVGIPGTGTLGAGLTGGLPIMIGSLDGLRTKASLGVMMPLQSMELSCGQGPWSGFRQRS